MPDALTWAGLLGKWTEFARSALALPRTAEGDRWRRAVPSIIGLQAVTMALGEVNALPPDERSLALDRAALLIARHQRELEQIWTTPHPELQHMLRDAHSALRSAADDARGGDRPADAASPRRATPEHAA